MLLANETEASLDDIVMLGVLRTVAHDEVFELLLTLDLAFSIVDV